ncbi:MAG: hypothetical protein A3I77_03900 [Gammaproteobacteria bacterium RIFCSPLOWO2_02_FULL_42_14]|nr:MAG: hypothetical protein A3B71_05205 [Gammaproteobacteria bacterium RIFCSPHIGHO2_02_FULL_42_43]OGT28548.1 MAG: hypothetical protein A2624_04005 [Gammaproteobacteria bacterium RIFCSPHIGHO2_01_FULL_42_8]OGT51396.1 MAG: hypothetical protein A3E54_04970 [Gammaproteobacteria bacterium RIFCSPHIGHO2_12_FULL_41_25]OGT62098.1 MAG: hypothetical protein A3I77_03900 [Gammaproteobacteria bacterium RIFCSPLOWO2_02_FULL_42_14]OGT85770.1 MAG: hypothetical protein A3G86_03595 [Gammaproteobacteria bacterium R
MMEEIGNLAVSNQIRVNAQAKINEFLENGYFLLENVIHEDLITRVKSCICEKLVKLGAPTGLSFAEQYKALSKNVHPYEINRLVMREIVCAEFPKYILTTPAILNSFINILGVDLAYEITSELPVNVKDEANDSLVKKFHQEFWSGAGYKTCSFWAPIFLEEGAGTMEMVKKSHVWGHIPHQNREPKWLPDDAEIVNIKCKEGDVLIFSSLTLHRTVKNMVECPRLAYTTTVRNIFEKYTGFDMMSSWEIFHLGAASRVLKKCGNPHLSPFRTYGSTRKPYF